MRVVVAMSGGVDSSAAAALLVEQGHEVIGITLRVWSYAGKAQCGSCCSPDDIDDARAVAEALGIPFYVADTEDIFKEKVIEPFVQSYLKGQTPIPCIACNRDVKFDFLLKRARSLGAKLATGHYARIEGEGNDLRLCRSTDLTKDQSYFLFTLGRDQLSDIIFPVGGMTKAAVREVAERHRLPTSRKPESMEICFVPDGNYAGFVEKIAGPQAPGEVVHGDGRVLGQHLGIHKFTIGQRKGIGSGHSEPLYVQKIEPETRRVVVGPAADNQRQSFQIRNPHWVTRVPPSGQEVQVKIRHRHRGATARVEEEQGGVTVRLEVPLSAVTPGQAAVFYDGDKVLGGGWIS